MGLIASSGLRALSSGSETKTKNNENQTDVCVCVLYGAFLYAHIVVDIPSALGRQKTTPRQI